MSDPPPKKRRVESLRQAAILRLERRRGDVRSEMDNEQLLEELQIHEIELELQNDELRRAQHELTESHHAYAELFNLAPYPFLALGPSMNVLRANDAAYELFGERISDGSAAVTLVPRSEQAELTTWIRHLSRHVAHRDFPIVRADGYEGVGAFLGRTVRGASTLLAIHDVSEARRTAAALAASERDMRRLASLAPDAIIVCHEGRIAYCNQAFISLMGQPQEVLLGTSFVGHFHADDQAMVSDFLAIPAEAAARTPVRLFVPSGGDRVVEMRTMAFLFAGQDAVLIVARDLTDRRRLEARMEQAERMATVGMLVAGVAHEINNPMAFTIANLEVLVEGVREGDVPRDELAEAAEECLAGVKRVANIVADLRAFQRVEDELAPVNPNAVVAQTLRLAEGEIAQRARLRRDLGVVPKVIANENRLVQVLLNLIVNGAQAMDGRDPDECWIRVRSWRTDRDVCLAVEDNGPGIAEDQLAHIFDPFFTTRRAQGGTGLGLAISNSLVQHMGGFIEVGNGPQGGARFVIHLQVADDLKAPGVEEQNPTMAELPDSLRLLIVDDESAIIRSIRRLLRSKASIESADSGNQAIAMLKKSADFDVILCDLVMSDGSGATVAQWLADNATHLANRLVFMTGMPHPDIPVASNAPVLQKPFSRESLERALGELLLRVGES